MNLYRIETTIENRPVALLTIIDPANKDIPINPKCIAGFLIHPQESIQHLNVQMNPAFMEHFHKTINFFSQLSDHPIQLAEGKTEGFVYITDKRCTNPSNPEKEDILGSYEVRHGSIVNGSYCPNPTYQFISESGICMLQPELEALICATAY